MGKRINTPASPTVAASKLAGSRKWPRFTEEQKQLVEGFLLRLSLDARIGAEKAVDLRTLSPENPNHHEQVQYWQHVMSALRWALHQTQGRQRQLDPAQFARMVSEVNE